MRWSARLLAVSAVGFIATSTACAVTLLAARCEGFSCTYIGVAWLVWLAVLCTPATCLGYLAQRSSAFISRSSSILRAAWLAHTVFAAGLLAWWLTVH
jgi:hypothetical protein